MIARPFNQQKTHGFTQHLGLSAFAYIRRKRIISALSAGFTVMELMIATTVFSILLLLSLAGFLQIGQLFYKGVNITRTSDAGNQVISSLREDISFDTGTGLITIYNSSTIVSGQTYNRHWFCVGQNRYTYLLGSQIDSNNKDVGDPLGWYRFALLKDQPGVPPPACPNPFSGSNSLATTKPTELLGDKMRLSNLTITQPANTLYTLSVHIAYGDDEVLTSPATAANVKCQSGANFSRYCFVTDLRTTVRRGIAP